MRGVNGDSRAANNALETINAAANVIASAENRQPHAAVQEKRRWSSCWSVYWCFGYHRHRKRIGHAVFVPETSAPRNNAPAAENPTQSPAATLLFIAPPSSPASFLQSEPPSATQSPAGVLSINSISANMYSPGGPASIFAIGPYAHETQLVSPPVFSTVTTEPSTAPFTPPPESVHLTTPSSPEVPFAQLLDPNFRNNDAGHKFPIYNYEFQSYQLHPGSPVGHLISPRSGISGSGTSSPFPDGEFAAGGPQFLEFRMNVPSKLWSIDKLSTREWGSHHGSGTLTPDAAKPASCSILLDSEVSDVALHPQSDSGNQIDQDVNHRVSFELTTEDASGCMERKPASSVKPMPESQENGTPAEREENSGKLVHDVDCRVSETSGDTREKAPTVGDEAPQHRKHPSLTLGFVKEFNFDSTDAGDSHRPDIGSHWWANGSVVVEEVGATKNWSFPMMHSDVT